MIRYEYIDKRSIVYVDESGFALDSPRTHGYAQTGKRCYGIKDWHARGRLNAIGAICNFEFITVDLWDSYIDSDVFYAWLTQSLIPNLPANSVVVLDNASFHKRQDMLDALTNAGHTPEFLPPYSPDLNPIEKKWAQAKALRRHLRCDPFSLFLHPNLCPFILN
jgi:transposase